MDLSFISVSSVGEKKFWNICNCSYSRLPTCGTRANFRMIHGAGIALSISLEYKLFLHTTETKEEEEEEEVEGGGEGHDPRKHAK